MFGFLALGIFGALALKGIFGGEGKGGFLSGILGASTLSEFLNKKKEDSDKKKKEKDEEISKKEDEMKNLLKKDKKDLTQRDIKRLKELQKDRDIDVEDFLTKKELKALSETTGYTPKQDISDADDDLSPEEKLTELKGLLKKKPADLTQKEKNRIKLLGSDPDIDTDELSEGELDNFKKATGKSIEDTQKEASSESNQKDMNKVLAVVQSDLESKENDSSQEAEDFRKSYDTFIKCAYDEDGNLRKPEDIEKEIDNLDDDTKKLLKENISAASKDEKTLEELKEKTSKVSDEDAAAAVEKAKAKRAEITKNDKIKELEEKRDKELEGATDEDKKKIEDSYKTQSEAETKKWDAKIKEHTEKAASLSKGESLRQMEKTAKDAEARKKELEEQKAKLDGEDAQKNEIEKCDKINWNECEYEKGDLDTDDEKKKKGAEEFLKSKGVSPELYKKYSDAKSSLKEGEDILDNEDVKKAVDENIKKQKEDLDKKIAEQDKIISDYNSKKNEADKTNEPKKGEEPKEDPKKGEEPKEDPKKGEKENSFEDEDGYVYKKDGDKYTMTDEKGQEIEIKKEDFEKAKEKAVDDEKEGDERTDNDDDLEDDEVDDKGNSTGKKDPRKIYKRRTYKRGDKTFKTKSYYDKKGNSISAKDFKEKVANFEKSNKQKDESFNISNFLKGKLIVERFYPRDITNYLQEHLR
jgi:hypothetical protein